MCDLSEEDSAKLNSKSRFGINALLLKAANMVLCPSRNALEITQNALHLDSTKASLIVNGINSCSTLNDDRIANIRTKLKLNKNKTTIVVNGGLEKNSAPLKRLQKVILNLKRFDEKIHFLIVGEPRKYLYAFLKKHNARSICSFTGAIAPKLLSQYYSACDIALTLDHRDSDENRINILNFMASALPVVAFENELRKHYLPEDAPCSRSISRLSNNLKDLCYNNELQSNLAVKNIQRFEEYYSWEVSKEQLYATYMQALG